MSELLYEKNVDIPKKDLLAKTQLNTAQKYAYNVITEAVFMKSARVFFVDGPAGTGKTFLYCALLAELRSIGHIALAVATSGVAASLLPGGRTAHSRFKIPIEAEGLSKCRISKQSTLAKLVLECSLIIWDEVSMAHREIVEALDKMLRDLTDYDVPLGGKVIVLGGDFRQITPVVAGGQKEEMIKASFVSSPLFKKITHLRLSENLRALQDPAFAAFLQKLGDGAIPFQIDDKICIPLDILFPFETVISTLDNLLNFVFPELHMPTTDPFRYVTHAILTPTNEAVDHVNDLLLSKLVGEVKQYLSYDHAKDDNQQGQYADFLNSLSVPGLPPHSLNLKIGCPIMLLRNLNPTEGLCNGTRLVCRGLHPRVIHAQISTGPFQGRETFIPRIPLECNDIKKCAIPFIRAQFPVKLCFALTINKAQGQTLQSVGIYLQEPVFSHGQLYVALSRATKTTSIKVLIQPPTIDDPPVSYTRNIVYQELLELANNINI